MNKVILIGNLVADPETSTTKSGITKCTFRLAVQRKYKNPQGKYESDFITVITWRQTADLCGKYLSKGRKVGVDGSIQSRSYDAQDGSKRYVTEVVAENVEFLTSKSTQDGGQSSNEREYPQSQDGFQEVDDEELPF